MRLFVIRHGETTENVEGICMGQEEGHLSEMGINQGRLLGKRLGKRKIDIIYSSDLKRALDTAEKILVQQRSSSLVTDKNIRERYFGKMQGIKWTEKKEKLLKNMESNEKIFFRVKLFFENICTKHQQDTVVIISHSGTIKMLLRILFQDPDVNSKINLQIFNTAIFEFEIINKSISKVHKWNCVNHLK